MSCLQLRETSLRQACITPRGMSQVVKADCSIADQIEKNEMGGGVGQVAGVGERKVHTGFRWGNLMERDHFGNLGLDWRIIVIWILKKWNGGMGWIDLAQIGTCGKLL